MLIRGFFILVEVFPFLNFQIENVSLSPYCKMSQESFLLWFEGNMCDNAIIEPS
jgi:hypothetical protein